jgi:D-alanyl-D-alanine carboxypeptidase
MVLLLLSSSYMNAETIEDKIGFSADGTAITRFTIGSGKQLLVIIAGFDGDNSISTRAASLMLDYFSRPDALPSEWTTWFIMPANPSSNDKATRLHNAAGVSVYNNFPTSERESACFSWSRVVSNGKKPLDQPESRSLHSLFEKISGKSKPIVLILQSHGGLVRCSPNTGSSGILGRLIGNRLNLPVQNWGYNSSGSLQRWIIEKKEWISIVIGLKANQPDLVDQLPEAVAYVINDDHMPGLYKQNRKIIPDHRIKLEKRAVPLDQLPEATQNMLESNPEGRQQFYELLERAMADEELILLVSKQHRLNSYYKPGDLVGLPSTVPGNKPTHKVRSIIVPDLEEMVSDALADGAKLSVISAYRSFETQERVYQYWIRTLGFEEASKVSAPPGASQHQLGTTIDFNDLYESFANTTEGQWLAENAWKYGFIMAYPKGLMDLSGYSFEPWHYRYIGRDAARMVHEYFGGVLEIYLRWYWRIRKDY